MTYGLFLGGGAYCGGFYVYAIFPGELQYGAGQLRFQFFRAIPQICLGGTWRDRSTLVQHGSHKTVPRYAF